MPRMATAARVLTSAGLFAACAHPAGSTSASSSSRDPDGEGRVVAGDTSPAVVSSRSVHTSKSRRSATPPMIIATG